METKLIFDLPFRDYLLLPGLNFSTLKLMGTSPKACKHAKEQPPADTDTLRLGRAFHTASLEPDQFLLEYALYPKRRQGKAWEAFRDANSDKTILTEIQYRNALAMRDAVRGSDAAMRYLSQEGRREVTILWEHPDTGVQCKSRIDWLCNAVVDLKSTQDPSPRAFARSVATYSYHAQAAFYSDAVAAATQTRLPSKIIAAGKLAELDVAVYPMTNAQIDTGRRVYRAWLDQYVECEASGQWPGVQEDEAELVLPEWAEERGYLESNIPKVSGPFELQIGGQAVKV